MPHRLTCGEGGWRRDGLSHNQNMPSLSCIVRAALHPWRISRVVNFHGMALQGAGAWAALIGLTGEVPFVSSMTAGIKLFHPEGGAELGSGVASAFVPQIVSETAKTGVPFTGGYGGGLDKSGHPIK